MIPHPKSLSHDQFSPPLEMANPVLYLLELKKVYQQYQDKVEEGKKNGTFWQLNAMRRAHIEATREYMRKTIYEYELILTGMCN